MHLGGCVGLNQGTVESSKVQITTNIIADSYAQETYGGRRVESIAVANVGGFACRNEGEITDCSSDATIAASATRATGVGGAYAYCDYHVGGFAQENLGAIKTSVATGSIADTTTAFTLVCIGGFVDENQTTVSNCHTDVDITIQSAGASGNRVGGFVGYNNKGAVANCYANGTVNTKTTGSKGGFVGTNETGATISKSFCDVNLILTNNTTTGYFVGKAMDGSTLFKCYYSNAATITNAGGNALTPTTEGGTATDVATLQSASFLFDTLAWQEDAWTVRALNYPKLSWES